MLSRAPWQLSVPVRPFFRQMSAGSGDLRRLDLEQLPDSRERAGAPVLWLSCEGQRDVWELLSDKTCLSVILDRQGLLVAAPTDLRTKKAESFPPQLLQGFWFKLKKRNPKLVVMSQVLPPKALSAMATVPFVFGRVRASNPRRKTLPYFGSRVRKDLVVEKGTIPSEKVPLPMDPPAWQETQVDFSHSRQSFASTGASSRLA